MFNRLLPSRKKEKKESFSIGNLFRIEEEGRKKTILWTMVAVLTVIIIAIWSFFFRYNLSLINTPKSGEEADRRKTEWKEIEDKFQKALEDWPKSFKKIDSENGGQSPAEIPEETPVKAETGVTGQK